MAVTEPSLTEEARLAKFAEAETLLLESNEALQQSEKADSKYKRDSLTRLVRLYQAWEKPDKAAEWQQRLDDFNRTNAKPEAGEKDASPGL